MCAVLALALWYAIQAWVYTYFVHNSEISASFYAKLFPRESEGGLLANSSQFLTNNKQATHHQLLLKLYKVHSQNQNSKIELL